MSVTIKDIAKMAEVSPSTVSKALNGKPDVGEATRKHIQEIAQKYNFTPSSLGRGLKSGLTENVGVIFIRESQPLTMNPFYSHILEGIELELTKRNNNMVLHLLPATPRPEPPKLLTGRWLDGVILVGVARRTILDQIHQFGLPVVLVDPRIAAPDCIQVLIDNTQGGFAATEHLIKQGHKNIGFISGSLDRLSFSERLEGYRQALGHYGIAYDERRVQSGGLEQGYQHMRDLLDLDEPPTAIFAANDINGIFAYKAIRESGCSIPEDISVIGFDDIDLAARSSPPLTTVRVFKEEMGAIAVRLLLDLVSGKELPSSTIMVPTQLVERESVAPIGDDEWIKLNS